eukprot:3298273-Rhodomonas_salina.1
MARLRQIFHSGNTEGAQVQVSRQHSKGVRHVDQQRAVQADGTKVVGGHRGHTRVPIHAQRNRVDGLGDSQGGVSGLQANHFHASRLLRL